jgi:hypothetical protein
MYFRVGSRAVCESEQTHIARGGILCCQSRRVEES